LIFKIHILLTFLSFIFEAYFFFDFKASFSYLIIIWLYWFLKHYILLSTFKFLILAFKTSLFQDGIFLSMTNQCQHNGTSFLQVNYKAVDIFYAFFTWLIDDLIFVIRMNGIFMLITWFELNSFSNCTIVFHNLLFLLSKFIFILITFPLRLLEIQQQN